MASRLANLRFTPIGQIWRPSPRWLTLAIGCLAIGLIHPNRAESLEKPHPEPANIAHKKAEKVALKRGNADFETYLDRLMMAESDGRDYLKNPRSTALGPYQFIKGTFLYVVRRHFTDDVAGLSEAEILALRTNRAFSRKVIARYSRELAAHLVRNGLKATYGHLRLAYLLGPGGATSVLKAAPQTPLRRLISPAAIRANPFMSSMSANEIIARANRDISMDRSKELSDLGDFRSAKGKKRKGPRIKIRCNLARASCRKWLALRKRKLARKLGQNS